MKADTDQPGPMGRMAGRLGKAGPAVGASIVRSRLFIKYVALLITVVVLALLANLCYCAAYLADLAIQNLLPNSKWNRTRWAIFTLGTLFAMLFESYWINDEIYPYVSQATSLLWR